MASEHAQKLREVAAQLSTERFQGWSNPLVAVITDVADFLDGSEQIDTGDAVLSRPTPVAPVSPTHRHKKRGSEYMLLGIGNMQAEMWVDWNSDPIDMREVAIYRSVDDGSLWARPKEEFEDGRFEALPVAVSPDATGKCGELETVGYVTTSPTGAEGFQRKPLVPGHGQFGYKQDAVVTRSQAEELLAAERARYVEASQRATNEESLKDTMHRGLLRWKERAEKAEAELAAERAEKKELDAECRVLAKRCIEKDARVKELEDERYKLAYAITGGEDAPGYLDSLSAETLVEVARKNTQHWFAETDRADKAETKLAACEKQLSKDRKLRNEAQCDADLWRFSVDMGDHPSLLVKVWKQRKALEAKLAAAEKALEPFATDADIYDDQDIEDGEKSFNDNITVGDLRKARAVLGGKPL